ESNRGAAVLTASLIEEQLGVLIRTALRDHSVTDDLLGHRGPLGGLYRRARMAFVMNLISEQELKDCDYIGRVRNQFAHRLAVSFADNKGLQSAVRDHSSRDATDLASQFADADREFVAEVTILGMVLGDALSRRIADRLARPGEAAGPVRNHE